MNATPPPEDDFVTVKLRVPRPVGECFEYLANLLAIAEVENGVKLSEAYVALTGIQSKPGPVIGMNVTMGLCRCLKCRSKMHGTAVGLTTNEQGFLQTQIKDAGLRAAVEREYDANMMMAAARRTDPANLTQARAALDTSRLHKEREGRKGE